MQNHHMMLYTLSTKSDTFPGGMNFEEIKNHFSAIQPVVDE
jgi:hypothetical protein